MANRGSNIGWQSGKTVLERNRYMLDNKIAADVCFEVGLTGGGTADIRAHKYMLISQSEVFEAMFCGQMAESRSGPDTKIKIVDIDADVFKELLRFIYYERVELNEETAMSLMYAANKYMLPVLVQECGIFLTKCLRVDNVCCVLELSLQFDVKNLTTDCLKFVSRNSCDVLNGNAFLTAPHDVVAAILDLDNLRLPESAVYDSCIKRAKFQLRTDLSIEDPDNTQIRETLGSLFFKIRFPAMDPREFLTIAEKGDLLTSDEKSSILYYFICKDDADQLLFKANDRFPEAHISRLKVVAKGPWNCPAAPDFDAINFTTDRDILLTGLGLYTGYKEVGYMVDIEIFKSGTSVFVKTSAFVPYTRSESTHKISLDPPVAIEAGIAFTISTYSYGSIRYYGKSRRNTRKYSKGNLPVTFVFSRHTVPNKFCRTGETCGQIPRLYFK